MQAVGEQASLPLDSPASDAADEVAPRKSYFRATASASAAVAPATIADDIVAPSANTPPPVVATQEPATPVLAPELAPLAKPAAIASTAPAPLPQVQAFTLPVDELSQIAQQSGLTWISSDTAKVAAAQAQIAAQLQAVHVPRERPPVAAQDDRPLVLVETKRDLRATTLPFETRPIE